MRWWRRPSVVVTTREPGDLRRALLSAATKHPVQGIHSWAGFLTGSAPSKWRGSGVMDEFAECEAWGARVGVRADYSAINLRGTGHPTVRGMLRRDVARPARRSTEELSRIVAGGAAKVVSSGGGTVQEPYSCRRPAGHCGHALSTPSVSQAWASQNALLSDGPLVNGRRTGRTVPYRPGGSGDGQDAVSGQIRGMPERRPALSPDQQRERIDTPGMRTTRGKPRGSPALAAGRGTARGPRSP
jgi:hypothetical protein